MFTRTRGPGLADILLYLIPTGVVLVVLFYVANKVFSLSSIQINQGHTYSNAQQEFLNSIAAGLSLGVVAFGITGFVLLLLAGLALMTSQPSSSSFGGR